jgi:regulator of sigma E protease
MIAVGQSAITLVVFLVVLGTLVLVHEVGHFVAARLARVTVLEFGIGFPPRARILGRGKPTPSQLAHPPRPVPALPPGIEPGSPEAEAFLAEAAARGTPAGTLYTLNWLPIGGFVKLEGEDGDADDDPSSFGRARLPTKLLILVAGVVMNLVLSFVIFAAVAFNGEPGLGLVIKDAAPGSPAAAVGLQSGDLLVAVNGQQQSAFDTGGAQKMIDDLTANAGRQVTLTVRRTGGQVEDIAVNLRVPTGPQRGALGVTIGGGERYGTVSYEPVETVAVGAQRTVDALGLILGGLGDLGRSIVTQPTSAPEASGPVGIAVQLGDVLWSSGPLYVLYMAGLLSANLALVNILPFPPLDGGRMLVIVLKALPGYGPRISVRAERLTYAIGFVALFAFLIWITVFDVARQLGGGTP